MPVPSALPGGVRFESYVPQDPVLAATEVPKAMDRNGAASDGAPKRSACGSFVRYSAPTTADRVRPSGSTPVDPMERRGALRKRCA
jgi:hypothetical protein